MNIPPTKKAPAILCRLDSAEADDQLKHAQIEWKYYYKQLDSELQQQLLSEVKTLKTEEDINPNEHALVLMRDEPEKSWIWCLGRLNDWRISVRPEPSGKNLFRLRAPPSIENPFRQVFWFLEKRFCPDYTPSPSLLDSYPEYKKASWEGCRHSAKYFEGSLFYGIVNNYFSKLITRRKPSGSLDNCTVYIDEGLTTDHKSIYDDLRGLKGSGKLLKNAELVESSEATARHKPYIRITKDTPLHSEDYSVVIKDDCKQVSILSTRRIQCPPNSFVILDCLWYCWHEMGRS